MKIKYALHPGEYAIGETEKFYADMAARGWRLEKRGQYFSRFRRSEPERLRYRIEISHHALFDDDTGLPDEQLALYEDCGWTFVTRWGSFNVFSAPHDSEAPELHTDPRQQAATLKGLHRSYMWGWGTAVLILAFDIFLAAALAGSAQTGWGGWAVSLRLDAVRHTAMALLWGSMILFVEYRLLYGAFRMAKLYRRLKRGIPLDHAPAKRRVAHRVVSGVLLALCVIGAALAVAQRVQTEKKALPLEADGPYLILKDLGLSGARSRIYDQESYVRTSRSLLADQWYTYECVDSHGKTYWMYQDVYELKSEALIGYLVPLLMENALFARDPSNFEQLDVEGLDAAYCAGMECIAVKGTQVYFITFFDPAAYENSPTLIDIMAELAAMLDARVQADKQRLVNMRTVYALKSQLPYKFQHLHVNIQAITLLLRGGFRVKRKSERII